MKAIALAATLAVAAGPAHAALQLAIDVGGTPFACVDNAACDQDPALGILAIGNQTIGGVIVNGSIQAADHGALSALSTSSLSIINENAAAVAVAAAISDTDFFSANSAVVVGIAGSGTWQGALGSSIALGWFVDPANAQGANTPTDAPGSQVGSFSNSPALIVDSFSDATSLSFATPSPFSMTLTVSGTLAPFAQLINRGQDIAAAPVPEAPTWALAALGFAALGFGALTRRRPRRPALL
jgi:hypothetical protein